MLLMYSLCNIIVVDVFIMVLHFFCNGFSIMKGLIKGGLSLPSFYSGLCEGFVLSFFFFEMLRRPFLDCKQSPFPP